MGRSSRSKGSSGGIDHLTVYNNNSHLSPNAKCSKQYDMHTCQQHCMGMTEGWGRFVGLGHRHHPSHMGVSVYTINMYTNLFQHVIIPDVITCSQPQL